MRILAPGETIEDETIKGRLVMHPRSKARRCWLDADGDLYNVECIDPTPWPETWSGIVPLFRSQASLLEDCEFVGAQTAILGRWCEVRGGHIHDANDGIKSAAPMWIHGGLAGALRIDGMGPLWLDPEGKAHIDGIQTWAPTLIEGAVHIDMRASGPGYQEKGAGIYVEPDFGQCGPIIVRNGVTMVSRFGYCMQVVAKSGTGPLAGLAPHPVRIARDYFHREDGKWPVNIAVPVEWTGNRRLDGTLLSRAPAF